MLLILVGPPGAGKGTQSARLAEYLGVPHCSTGEMFREACQRGSEVGQQAQEYMDSGRLVPDSLVEKLVEQRLIQEDCRGGCVLDGFPRTLVQAQDFDKWCEANYRAVGRVIELRVKEETLLARLDARGRADDNREVARERLRQYEELTRPLVDYYTAQGVLETVDGIGDVAEVFQRITAAIGSGQGTS